MLFLFSFGGLTSRWSSLPRCGFHPFTGFSKFCVGKDLVNLRKLNLSLFVGRSVIGLSGSTMSTDSPRVAVVTGANKGIGYAIVRQLADPNLSLTVVLTSRDEERGKQAVAALAAEGLDVLFHQLDITKEPSISAFANWLKDRFQGLDILVNNAGMAYRGDAFGYEVAKDTVDCNYFGTLHVIEKLSPLLREGARVVNVSSRAGKFSRLSPQLRNAMFRRDLTIPELSAMMNDFIQSVKEGTWEQKGWPKQTYAVSKMGVTIMTRILAREEKRPNILYNACCPGYVRTDMTNPSAPLSPEQGAKTPVYLALLPEGGVSGGFFADGRQWNIMEEL